MSHKLQADLVLLNGKIITMNRNDTIAEAVAAKDGKIIEVGTSRDARVLATEKTKILDLKGKSVVPGFIDAHIHMDATAANMKLAVSCHIPPVKYFEVSDVVTSLDDILEKMKERIQKTPKGEWIIGQGRFALQWDGNSPTREQLDEIAPDHPVMIRYNAHAYILNSKALESAKITRDKPTQEELERLAPGARICRDPRTGRPTGLMTECWDWIFPIHCPWPYEQLKETIKKTCFEATRFGVTTIHEFLSWPESTRVYQELLRSSEATLRVQLCPTVWGLYRSVDLDCLLKLGWETGFGNEWLKFGSVKIFVDVEGLDEKGEYQQWIRITQKKLNELVCKAHKAGIRVMMHATTRNGQNMALNAVQAALEEMPKKDHRHRIEHFAEENWRPELERLEKLGIIPVPQPYSSYSWYGDAWLNKHAESAYSGGVVTYRTLFDKGLMPPGNSDCVGTEPEGLNPWWSIWCAVARKTQSGKLICPEESITVMEAIRMYTINSAYAGFEEKIKGSIEPGKLADLVVLTEDPLTVPTDRLRDIEVEMTIIDGKIVYDRKSQ